MGPGELFHVLPCRKKVPGEIFITNLPIAQLVLFHKTFKLNVKDIRFRYQSLSLEHNFGHGKKNLSALLMTFNLLAFDFICLLGYNIL